MIEQPGLEIRVFEGAIVCLRRHRNYHNGLMSTKLDNRTSKDLEFCSRNWIGTKSMVKTPQNRLLDLTYGWYQFVEAEESREEEPLTDDRILSQELFDLYQATGAQDFEETEEGILSAGGEAEVRAFVNEKILPLLLRQ